MLSKEPIIKNIDGVIFDLNDLLGSGAFGKVYKATLNGKFVAVKVIPTKLILENDTHYTLFMREINVLRQLKGSHIVKLLDVKRTPNNLYIIIDYCDGGDLEQKIKTKHKFTEDEACSILKQITNAFITIVDQNIVTPEGKNATIMHRDIKAANILFHEGKVKVADFGFAKFVEEAQQNTRVTATLLGTPAYMPPQILNHEKYSTKCDIWSTGVLFYQMLFGKSPYTGHSVPSLYRNIKNKPLEIPSSVKAETKDLLKRMLQFREEDRLSWKDVCEHPALKIVNLD